MRSTMNFFKKVKPRITSKPKLVAEPKPPTLKNIFQPHLFDRVLLANRIAEMERQIAAANIEDVKDIPIDLAKVVDELSQRCTPGGFGQ